MLSLNKLIIYTSSIFKTKSKKKKMIYLSKWILNLGVVPLLLFKLFLLLPAFVFLLALFVFVILVFETILRLLKRSTLIQLNKKHNFKYLQSYAYKVKVLTTILLFFNFSPIQATENTYKNQTHVLGIGEIYPIRLLAGSRYTIGNKEVIRGKLDKNSLLVKGAKQGMSDLLIWGPNQNQPTHLQFYTYSKLKKLQLVKKLKMFENIGLHGHFEGDFIELKGIIKNIEKYNRFIKHFDKESFIYDEVILSKELKKKIYDNFIYEALESYHDNIACEFESIHLICKFDQTNIPDKELVTNWKKRFLIKLHPINIHKNRQFKLNLHLIQMESLSGEHIGFGLEKFQTTWVDLFTNGVKALINKNELVLKNEKIKLNGLASPEIIFRPKEPVTVSIGGEYPYKEESQHGASLTTWKFAGFKLKLTLTIIGKSLVLNYKTNLSKPTQDGSISGNTQASSVILDLNEPTQVFKISYKTSLERNQKLPWIGSIPILGNLFTSTENAVQFKTINGIIKLEEI